MEPGQLVELVGGVYGLGDAPLHFRQSLKRELVSLGYRQSTFVPTVFLLFPEKGIPRPLVNPAMLGRPTTSVSPWRMPTSRASSSSRWTMCSTSATGGTRS